MTGLGLYHHAPPFLRSIAATIRGWQLRRQRYGRDTDRLAAEALARESWSGPQWRAYQEQQLAMVLHRAATRVPYYRAYWESMRQRGEPADWSVLANWPVLEKATVRSAPERFVADDCLRSRLVRMHTSGSTGSPLPLWKSRATLHQWYAWFEARWRMWYGVTRHDRWAIIGGQLVAPVGQRKPPFWVWNGALKQLYMSAYHLAPDLIPAYVDALARYRIVYLWGYTSSLFAVAQECLRAGIEAPQLKVVITNAEPVYEWQKRIIAQVFRCPVRETYGMAEAVAAASECEHGGLHLWPEAGLVEVLEQGRPVAPGQAGDLVCTGFSNQDMPLIRYRTGDRGRLRGDSAPCKCGRTLPQLAAIEGRCDDVIFTADGRRVGRMHPAFATDLPVRELQVVQAAIGRIVIRYVPVGSASESLERDLAGRICARLGAVRLAFEPCAQIPRGPNGKFRAVVCNLSDAERDALLDACSGVHGER